MIGTQPTGGIGLIKSNNGLKNISNFSNHAIQIPNGTPKPTPIINPKMDSFKLVRICAVKTLPSGFVLDNLYTKTSTIVCGLGSFFSDTSPNTSVTNSQIKIKTIKDTTDISKYFLFSLLSFFVISSSPLKFKKGELLHLSHIRLLQSFLPQI